MPAMPNNSQKIRPLTSGISDRDPPLALEMQLPPDLDVGSENSSVKSIDTSDTEQDTLTTEPESEEDVAGLEVRNDGSDKHADMVSDEEMKYRSAPLCLQSRYPELTMLLVRNLPHIMLSNITFNNSSRRKCLLVSSKTQEKTPSGIWEV